MPLKTETIDFDEEINRLQQEREELAEQLADVHPNNPIAESIAQRGQDIDTYLKGLHWARDDAFDDDSVPVWGADADSVTLSGLTGGEFGMVEDRLVGDAAKRGESPGSGATRVHLVAKGTVEAPYLDPDADDNQRVGAASQLPITFLKWAEHRVNEMTTIGGNGQRSFAALVSEKRQKKALNEE